MRRIADANELERELRRLLAYAQRERPSRSSLATALRDLSHRTAAHDVRTADNVQSALAKASHIVNSCDAAVSSSHDKLLDLQQELESDPGLEEAYVEKVLGSMMEIRGAMHNLKRDLPLLAKTRRT